MVSNVVFSYAEYEMSNDVSHSERMRGISFEITSMFSYVSAAIRQFFYGRRKEVWREHEVFSR